MHRRISWDLGTRSEYCLAGGYGFAKDKGDQWMTEESYVDTRTRLRVVVMFMVAVWLSIHEDCGF
jgi:hypothetical protein